MQVRQSGGGGGGVETANIMLAQLNAQKAVKSKNSNQALNTYGWVQICELNEF